jgi:serine/threonine protein kinase
VRDPVKFGDYYLFERVAVGGMAEVFKAVSYGVEGFERLCAIKRVLPSISEDQEFINMFIDEAKIAVRLAHANIGQVFELGNAEDSYFIAMEFVAGRDTRAIFDRERKLGRRLDIPMCCHIVKEVCEALEYAHKKRDDNQVPLGIIHRDVSPQNVLVSYEGEVKLIDFGIAKAAGKANKTQAGILKGKFGYMSPEQVRGRPIDQRSDIFAMAVVLYELLTLERCFQGQSDFSTLEKVREVDYRRATTLNREIPPELERILTKGLARDPDERFQSAAEFQDALQKFLYQSGSFYSRKNLSAYMKKVFATELKAEQVRLSNFRHWAQYNVAEAHRAVSVPLPLVSKRREVFEPNLPALGWSPEDEAEPDTEVYDRVSMPQINTERDLPAQSPRDIETFEELPPASRDDRPPLRAEVQRRLLTLIAVGILAVVAGVVALLFLRPQPATLILQSTPADVRVFIDGRLIHEGATPLRVGPLTASKHRVKVEADGYLTNQRAIALEEDETLRVRFDLKPLPTRLTLESVPGGARVHVDGNFVDETPLRVNDLAPGKHLLQLEKEGYQPWQGNVTLTEGVENRVQPTPRLYPQTVSMTLIPEPSNATITLRYPDDTTRALGKGPQTIVSMPNRGKIVAITEAPGYLRRDQLLPKVYTSHEPVLITLERAPQRATSPVEDDEVLPVKPPVIRAVNEDRPRKITSTGKIKFLAKPPAQIFIDGKNLGWTPLMDYPLPTGRHEVRLEREKAPAYRKTLYIEIIPNKTVFRRYLLPVEKR